MTQTSNRLSDYTSWFLDRFKVYKISCLLRNEKKKLKLTFESSLFWQLYPSENGNEWKDWDKYGTWKKQIWFATMKLGLSRLDLYGHVPQLLANYN